MELVKDRCTLLPDFWEHSFFFFKAPIKIDFAPVLARWNDAKKDFFYSFNKTIFFYFIKKSNIEKVKQINLYNGPTRLNNLN